MHSVIDILENLESTSSRLDKEDILQRHSSNELLKKVFIAALDPYTVYYVNKFRLPKSSSNHNDDDDVITDLVDNILPALSSRTVTGNEAKNFVIEKFKKMNDRQQKWAQRIILKNLRCGVQDSTVNKVWHGLVKKFSVSLANTLKTVHDREKGIKIVDNVKYPVRVEPKLDGLRCVAVKKNGNVTLYTRNGSELNTLPRIKNAVAGLDADNIVLDGEVMGSDWNESTSVAMSHKNNKDDSNITYYVFDVIPINVWESQNPHSGTPLTLQKRILLLSDIVFNDQDNPIKIVEGITVNNELELLEFYASALDRGYEGIMLKDIDSLYLFKRSDAILKMKPVVTYEGVIVGHYEGRRGTKWEGRFGGFDVLLPNGIITRVGGGFNDKFRAEVQLNGPESYIGTIVEIEAQPDPTTKDGLTKDGKARFPVFNRIRHPSDVDSSVLRAYHEYVQN